MLTIHYYCLFIYYLLGQIPRGTQPNTVMQMRGKGIKELNSNRRGSQLVNLQVHIPKYVSSLVIIIIGRRGICRLLTTMCYNLFIE